MDNEYELLLEKSRERNTLIKRQMKYLGKFHIKNFDHVVADFSAEVFLEIDCLKCGNCCRTIGPKMNEPEIKRACKAFGFEQKSFMTTRLVRHDELGWMCASMPCPFLGEGNACGIYDDRPKDCDDFPYMTQRGIQRDLGRLAFNTGFCPAAYLIAEKIIERYAPGLTK